jgi:hypothetical protein
MRRFVAIDRANRRAAISIDDKHDRRYGSRWHRSIAIIFFDRVQGVRSIASSQQAIKRQTTFAQTMKPRAVWFSMFDH